VTGTPGYWRLPIDTPCYLALDGDQLVRDDLARFCRAFDSLWDRMTGDVQHDLTRHWQRCAALLRDGYPVAVVLSSRSPRYACAVGSTFVVMQMPAMRLLADETLTFILAHELGHVIRHVRSEQTPDTRAEERAADTWGVRWLGQSSVFAAADDVQVHREEMERVLADCRGYPYPEQAMGALWLVDPYTSPSRRFSGARNV